MPKPSLHVAVLTLSPGEEAALEGPLGDQVRDLIAQGALRYTISADDWIPFDDNTTILRHLTDGLASFELLPRSDTLTSFRSRSEVRLFVIDPVVLLHPGKAQLAVLIQEHVCSRDDKASCVVVFGALPAPYARPLVARYREKLSDLLEVGGDLFEYKVDDAERLNVYLRRIGRRLGDVPVSQRQSEANAFMAGIAGSVVPPLPTPSIGAGVPRR